jgi:hypothetical protein
MPAPSFRRRGVGQVAARGGVVDGRRQADDRAEDDEREWTGDREWQDREDPGEDEADDHQRYPLGSVGQPAEGWLPDQPSRGPGSDHDPEGRKVNALIGEVEREHRQQATEAEPDDELGEQQRSDAAPSRAPGGERRSR